MPGDIDRDVREGTNYSILERFRERKKFQFKNSLRDRTEVDLKGSENVQSITLKKNRGFIGFVTVWISPPSVPGFSPNADAII